MTAQPASPVAFVPVPGRRAPRRTEVAMRPLSAPAMAAAPAVRGLQLSQMRCSREAVPGRSRHCQSPCRPAGGARSPCITESRHDG
jgi:hypothetical protein